MGFPNTGLSMPSGTPRTLPRAPLPTAGRLAAKRKALSAHALFMRLYCMIRKFEWVTRCNSAETGAVPNIVPPSGSGHPEHS